MDKETEHKVRSSYVTISTPAKADSLQQEFFSDFDETTEFDLETEAEDCLTFLRNSTQVDGDVGVRIRNFDMATTELKIDIARAIKGFWESNSFSSSDDTIIIVSGTESLSQYENSLSGRVYPH